MATREQNVWDGVEDAVHTMGPEQKRVKLPFLEWDKYCPTPSHCYEYFPEDEGAWFIDPQKIVGVNGAMLPESPDAGERHGVVYERDVIGQMPRIPVVSVRGDRKVPTTMEQMFREWNERKKNGKKLPGHLAPVYADLISGYFDRLDPKRLESSRGAFINDFESILQKEVSAVEEANGMTGRFEIHVYPSLETPLDALGIDFFVELRDRTTGVKKRTNCDVTINLAKNVARGHTHLTVGRLDLPATKNAGLSDERYRVQVGLLAQKITYMFFRGAEMDDFDVVPTSHRTH